MTETRDPWWQRYICVRIDCLHPHATEVRGIDSPTKVLELLQEDGWAVYSMFAGKGHLMEWSEDERLFIKVRHNV